MTDAEFNAIEEKITEFKALKKHRDVAYNALNLLSDHQLAQISIYNKRYKQMELSTSELPGLYELLIEYFTTQLNKLSSRMQTFSLLTINEDRNEDGWRDISELGKDS